MKREKSELSKAVANLDRLRVLKSRELARVAETDKAIAEQEQAIRAMVRGEGA